MKPIPKHLLIHTAELIEVDQGDYGETDEAHPITLTRVRVEPCNKAASAKDNRTLGASYRLFYDCRNSMPADVPFDIDRRVVFEGEEFRIMEAGRFYDGQRLHHWEVLLCR